MVDLNRMVSWCGRFSIGARLVLVFSVLVGLFVVAVSFSIQQTGKISLASQAIISERLQSVALVNTARGSAQSGAALLYSLLLRDQRPDRVETYRRIDIAARERDAAIAQLLQNAAGDASTERREILHRVIVARDRFVDIFLRTVEEVEINPVHARVVMVGETAPALEAMLSSLDTLVAAEWRRAEAMMTQIRTLQARARQASIVIGAACALFAMLAAWVITRSIAVPLRRTAEFAREVAGGHLDGPLPEAGRDEVGALVRALDDMRHGIASREARISDLAYRDSLTGLPNRTLFNDRLRQALSGAARAGHAFSVMLLDLDRFKQVNDVLGHPVGDELLVQVARRLGPVLQRESDTLARIGGDEFAVLLPTQGAEAAAGMARSLIAVLGAPVELHGHTIDLAASIGVASYPLHGDSAEQLLSRADTAMYVAKEAGDGYALFDPKFDRSSATGLSLLSDLRQAIAGDEFTLFLQPKLALADGRCRGAEALIRWQPTGAAPIPPDHFIPFCEQTGFIRQVTRWVLNRACALAARQQGTAAEYVISINVSARDLMAGDFPEMVAQALRAASLPARLLCLEITESAIMEDPGLAQAILDRLSAMGIALSIDDFGTGYSSLAYLKKLPVSELKIDRSFVRNLATDADDRTIVRATIGLAHSLGLRVVAEGVETQEAVNELRSLDCDLVQGYFYSRPLPEPEFLAWRARQVADCEEVSDNSIAVGRDTQVPEARTAS